MYIGWEVKEVISVYNHYQEQCNHHIDLFWESVNEAMNYCMCLCESKEIAADKYFKIQKIINEVSLLIEQYGSLLSCGLQLYKNESKSRFLLIMKDVTDKMLIYWIKISEYTNKVEAIRYYI